MIPLRLSLKNFMSYRGQSPELDLRGVHVVCLAGDNGHGKSALLDAMTWALWGYARGQAVGTRNLPTDSLVHMGQTDMEVSLEFLAGETRYRAVRKHGRAPRGSGSGGSLDLQVAASGDAWRSISESSLSATQTKLTRLLQMDYETFVNTAFLLQGQADRFARADPKDRKDVLGEILGLGLYDRLAERSRSRANEARQRLAVLEAEAQRLDAELAALPDARAAADASRAALDSLAPEVESAARSLEAARLRLALQDKNAQEERRIQQEQESRQRALADAKARLQRLAAQRAACEQTLAAHDAILAEGLAFQEARAALAGMENVATRFHSLRQAEAQYQRAIEVALARLEGELQNARRRADELSLRASTAPQHERAAADAGNALLALDQDTGRLRERQAEAQALRDRAQALDAEATSLNAELEKLRNQLRMLTAEKLPVCPVCRTPLGPEGRQHLEEEITAQGKALRAQQDSRLAEAKGLRARADALQRETDAADAALRKQREDLLRKQAAAQRSLEDARAAASEHTTVLEQSRLLSARLTTNDFAQTEQRGLAHARQELTALAYDQQAHQELRQQVAALEPVAERARAVREAAQRLPEVLADIADTERRIAEAEGGAAVAVAELARIARELLARPALLAEVSGLDRQRQALLSRQQEAQQALARAEARVNALADAAERKQVVDREARTLQDERATHELLADSFGRNGIQAMLIGEALPDLETGANELLSRLTDGRMSLKLETERQTRRGGSVDTLDLLVADELGTRSFDLFSGGEAFRVSFALRVALARLLARRAGAPLRTLLIDEGFGTQDAAGRERLVEAIKAIQDGFDLIMVITHLDEVKDAFPVRLEVTKSDGASTFRMVA
jgi:exonuclease SbcC